MSPSISTSTLNGGEGGRLYTLWSPPSKNPVLLIPTPFFQHLENVPHFESWWEADNARYLYPRLPCSNDRGTPLRLYQSDRADPQVTKEWVPQRSGDLEEGWARWNSRAVVAGGGGSIWGNVLEYYDYEIAWFIHLGYLMNSMKRRSTYVQGLCCCHSVIVIVPWPPFHVTSLCSFTKPGKKIA